MASDAGLPLNIEFGGGAEYLFDNKKKHSISLPAGQEWTLGKLILWMRDNLLTERPELFVQNDTVVNQSILDRWQHRVVFATVARALIAAYFIFIFRRPGILVLVNEADWELLGQEKYVLQANDTVLFISTLHGG